jgi:Domain of unknown function (DUF4410)
MARIDVVLHRACIAITTGLVLGSAGCATNGANVASFFGGGPAKPKSVVVSEFELAPGTVSVDGGLAPSYRRKLGKATPDQLKAELTTAVNEAVAESMVATLTDGGLPATAGSGEAVDGDCCSVVVSGRIRKVDNKDQMKRRLSGLAPIKSNVTAEVKLSQEASGARKELLAFVGDDGVKPPAAANVASSATANAAPATTASTGSEPKLTSSVAAEARRIGKVSANRILAFAVEQGWITKPTQSAAN